MLRNLDRFACHVFCIATLIALCAAWPLQAADEEPQAVHIDYTPAQKQAIEQLRKNGVLVLELAQNDNRLDIGFHLADVEIKDEHLQPLSVLGPAVYAVNLRGTKITDEGLKALQPLTELRILHLEKTGITDKGLQYLKPLAKLEYLNIYGTAVTDAGVAHLASLKNLKRLYIWQSKVTAKGVEELKKAIPGVQVVPDLHAEQLRAEQEKAKQATEKKPDAKKADAKKPDEKKPADKKPADKKPAAPKAQDKQPRGADEKPKAKAKPAAPEKEASGKKPADGKSSRSA